jgi:membrane fusion protein
MTLASGHAGWRGELDVDLSRSDAGEFSRAVARRRMLLESKARLVHAVPAAGLPTTGADVRSAATSAAEKVPVEKAPVEKVPVEKVPPEATPTPLFRAEALAERRAPWLGTVLLAPQLSHRVYTAVAVVAAAAVLALLFGASFTRTARLNGWLVPPQGVVRVMAPRPGVVTALHVAEGARVRQGQPLVTLSDELQSSALGGVQAEVARHLGERSRSLNEEREQQRGLLEKQRRALTARLAAMRGEEAQFSREIEVLKARVAIAKRNESLHREQREQGFISDMRLQIVESEVLEQVARSSALERNLMTLRREKLAVSAELNELPLRLGKEIATLDRSVAQVGQERAEAEGRREIVIQAPGDGTVTAIQAVVGAAAGNAVPLLAIVPADHRLEAHLYGPSRSIGFVQPGQRVLVRYPAFPYQRFGHHEGVVASVSRTAVSPSDLPASYLAASAGSAGGGSSAAEPIYRIVVELASQGVTAYGQTMALQPGMALEADVSLERRRLVEWVLEPLYAVTGKWHD